ncbi:MAG: sigma 54-interacting transcriptional regulator, partial [Bacteroidales bacterium]|nr:sigma 54-interacting transcriptional regulator [Bacteroidales bacterium]
LPLSLQAKLLAVLQNRTIVKLGSNKPIPVDIRLITATNKDLRAMVAEGLFREDLLYRINTITIELPPLRERGEDVLLLAEYYLQKYATKYNKAGIKLSRKAAQKLLKHQWPGNVRELQHSIEKAVILADSAVLHEESFALHSPGKSTVSHLPQKTIEEMEKEMIRLAIEKENGNMSAVAKTLGISRPTLYKKLKSLEK